MRYLRLAFQRLKFIYRISMPGKSSGINHSLRRFVGGRSAVSGKIRTFLAWKRQFTLKMAKISHKSAFLGMFRQETILNYNLTRPNRVNKISHPFNLDSAE